MSPFVVVVGAARDSNAIVFVGMSTTPESSLSRPRLPSLRPKLLNASFSGRDNGKSGLNWSLAFNSCNMQHPPPQHAALIISVPAPFPSSLETSSEFSESSTVEARLFLDRGVWSSCTGSSSDSLEDNSVPGVVTPDSRSDLSDIAIERAEDCGDAPYVAVIDSFRVCIGSSGIGSCGWDVAVSGIECILV